MAQVAITLLTDTLQVLVDTTALTATWQVYNAATNTWDTAETLNLSTSSEAVTFAKKATFSAGIDGTGDIGALTAGTGVLGTANTWTAEQTMAALLASNSASPYGAGVFASVLGATTAQKIQSGTGSTAIATAGTAVTTPVTFATAYASAPLVLAVPISAASTAGYNNVLAGTATTTGFTVTANSYAAQTIDWAWIAIGN